MAQHRWRDNPDVVSVLIDKGSVSSWSSKDIVLKPNEACAIIQDGKVKDILSETVMKNQVGGFGRWLGNALGLGATDSKLLFAITGPIGVCMPIRGMLGNGESVQGLGTLRVQIQRDHLPKLLNLYTNGPREISKQWLSTQLQREFDERVVRPLLGTIGDASEMRNSEFQERFEMSAEVEMRNICQLWGITLLKAYCSTDPTDLEKAEALRAKISAQTAQREAITDAEMDKIEQQETILLRRIESEYEVAKAKAKGEVSVELEYELKELRAEEARWEAELNVERQRLDMSKDDRQHKTEMAMSLFEQVQAAKRERMSQTADANLERQQHTDNVQTEMMKMAAENGALTPEVMQSFLDNQSAQKQADQSAQTRSPQSSSSGQCSCGQLLEASWVKCPACGKDIL